MKVDVFDRLDLIVFFFPATVCLGGKRLITDMDKLMQRTDVDAFCAVLECLVFFYGTVSDKCK